MQNSILKFRQSSCISEKPGYLPKKFKTLTSSTTVEFNIFCGNFPHVSVLRMSTKMCVGFFFILFRSWVIDKNGFCECVETRYFLILANNSSSKQNRKNPTHPFVEIGK